MNKNMLAVVLMLCFLLLVVMLVTGVLIMTDSLYLVFHLDSTQPDASAWGVGMPKEEFLETLTSDERRLWSAQPQRKFLPAELAKGYGALQLLGERRSDHFIVRFYPENLICNPFDPSTFISLHATQFHASPVWHAGWKEPVWTLDVWKKNLHTGCRFVGGKVTSFERALDHWGCLTVQESSDPCPFTLSDV